MITESDERYAWVKMGAAGVRCAALEVTAYDAHGVLTLYKQTKEKVRPVDLPYEGGIMPGGGPNWQEACIAGEKKYAGWYGKVSRMGHSEVLSVT